MGKMCGTALGIAVAGAMVGMAVYMCMPAHEQKCIQRGMKDVVDDLRDIADRLA